MKLSSEQQNLNKYQRTMCLTPRVNMQKSVVFYSDYEYSFHLHYPGKDNIELDLFNNGIYLVLRKLLSDIVPMETCDIRSQFLIRLSKSLPFNSGRYCILITDTYPKWGNVMSCFWGN